MKNQITAFLTLLLLHLFNPHTGYSQTIHVETSRLTTLDSKGVHLTLLELTPKVELRIPDTDTTNARYFDLFYTWDAGDDPNIYAMMIPQNEVDELYIDFNRDRDLRNDGPPLIFKHTENSISFDIISAKDPNQKTRLVLERKPELSDSTMISHFVDRNGDLQEKFAQMWGAMKGDFNYKGKKGTFYFDDRMCLRRGILNLDRDSILIGLLDYTNNGLFADDEDLIILDLKNDGKMDYDDETEIFKLNDVFTIQSQNYKIAQIDKYGHWVDIVETEEKATFYYLKQEQQFIAKVAKKKSTTGELDKSFWDLKLTTINYEKIETKDFKGKFLLLNFWGEWCKPCLEEIPDLIEIDKTYSDQEFQILSFLKSNNLEKAIEIINEKKIKWMQIIPSEDIISQFKIQGYPTNILLFPDGRQYIQTNQINLPFIDDFVNQN